MLARLLVWLWLLVYGRFRIRGSGALIRIFYPITPGLKAYPLDIPGLGTVPLDFGDGTAFSLLLRFKLNDPGTDVGLYAVMENFLRPGDVLWDIGAFVGYISAHFANPKYQLSSIQAFEPNPASIVHLRRLLQNAPKVQIHPFALGKAEQVLDLAVSPRSSSMASLARHEGQGGKVAVQVRPGDAVQQQMNLPLPDAIKIDVEGFEPDVIMGLSRTIETKRPVIVFEHIFLSDAQIHDLVPSEYQLYFIGDDGTVRQGMSSRRKGHDALLVPSEKKEIEKLPLMKE